MISRPVRKHSEADSSRNRNKLFMGLNNSGPRMNNGGCHCDVPNNWGDVELQRLEKLVKS